MFSCNKKLFTKLEIGLGTHLLVKVPRPGDSEETFLVLRVKLPPLSTSLITQRQRQYY